MLLALMNTSATPWESDPVSSVDVVPAADSAPIHTFRGAHDAILCSPGEVGPFFNQCYTTTALWTEIWVFAAVIVALVGFMAIWFASVREKGVAVGGALGLIPAGVFAASSMVLWPVYLVLAVVYRARLLQFAKTSLALKPA